MPSRYRGGVSALGSQVQTKYMVTNNITIAVIDDDASLRTALSGLLRSFGHTVCAFTSAEEFLESDGRARARCIITDIHMPGMSGIDLFKRLSADGSNTPVILITGRAEPSLLARAEASGAACVLKKPFDADRLMTCVENAIAGAAN